MVDAVDVSESAMRRLQGAARLLGLNLALVVADTDDFPLPSDTYDLIVVFYFFSEPLIHQIIRALKQGGMIVYGTFNYLHKNLKPDFNESYLAPTGGLAPFFPGMEVIVDEPESGEALNLSRLIARK